MMIGHRHHGDHGDHGDHDGDDDDNDDCETMIVTVFSAREGNDLWPRLVPDFPPLRSFPSYTPWCNNVDR